MTRFASLSTFAIAFAAVACQVDDRPIASPDPLADGQALYQLHCEGCHGIAGRGDGPIAELLKVPPPDLTGIATRNGGAFPVDQLVSWIDGRESMEGHGSREMPVWGNVWTDQEGGADVEQDVARQINELVEYIRTLQETS